VPLARGRAGAAWGWAWGGAERVAASSRQQGCSHSLGRPRAFMSVIPTCWWGSGLTGTLLAAGRQAVVVSRQTQPSCGQSWGGAWNNGSCGACTLGPGCRGPCRSVVHDAMGRRDCCGGLKPCWARGGGSVGVPLARGRAGAAWGWAWGGAERVAASSRQQGCSHSLGRPRTSLVSINMLVGFGVDGHAAGGRAAGGGGAQADAAQLRSKRGESAWNSGSCGACRLTPGCRGFATVSYMMRWAATIVVWAASGGTGCTLSD